VKIKREDVKKEQIIDLFEETEAALGNGLWMSGISGEGEFKSWYENGQMSEHSFFKNGVYHGEKRIWDPNGNLTTYGKYENGKLEGLRENT
jgi:hypothetical protein